MDVHSFRGSDSSHWLDHADYLGDDGRQPDPQELFPRNPRVDRRARGSRNSLANHGAIATDRKANPELDAQSLMLRRDSAPATHSNIFEQISPFALQ